MAIAILATTTLSADITDRSGWETGLASYLFGTYGGLVGRVAGWNDSVFEELNVMAAFHVPSILENRL